VGVNLVLMKTNALYTGNDIIVSLSFLNSREGALKKKFRNFCQNAGLTTTHF